ncbi:MAG: SapC family protein [Pseudomonadota bacterium]
MSPKIVPISKAAHAAVKINAPTDFPHAKNAHLARVGANEIALASMDYPVVLIREPKGERFHFTAMLGFENRENVYYRAPRWRASYVPASLALVPFCLGQSADDSNTLVPSIDESSPYLSQDEGLALFDADGAKTDFLNSAEKDLEALYQNELATQHFIGRLKDLDLLRPFTLELKFADGRRKSVVGMFMVSHEKLAALPDAEALEFFRNGYLVPVYAMLSSLSQVQRMIEFRNEGDGVKIAGFDFKPADE